MFYIAPVTIGKSNSISACCVKCYNISSYYIVVFEQRSSVKGTPKVHYCIMEWFCESLHHRQMVLQMEAYCLSSEAAQELHGTYRLFMTFYRLYDSLVKMNFVYLQLCREENTLFILFMVGLVICFKSLQ